MKFKDLFVLGLVQAIIFIILGAIIPALTFLAFLETGILGTIQTMLILKFIAALYLAILFKVEVLKMKV